MKIVGLLLLFFPGLLFAQNNPVIHFISVSNSNPLPWKEELKIRISYFDADGDLGENSPGITNLIVTDSREEIKYPFRIRRLLAEGKKGSIKGILEIVIDYVPLMNENSEGEEFRYSIQVTDRAGKSSNLIYTDKITLRPQK